MERLKASSVIWTATLRFVRNSKKPIIHGAVLSRISTASNANQRSRLQTQESMLNGRVPVTRPNQNSETDSDGHCSAVHTSEIWRLWVNIVVEAVQPASRGPGVLAGK